MKYTLESERGAPLRTPDPGKKSPIALPLVGPDYNDQIKKYVCYHIMVLGLHDMAVVVVAKHLEEAELSYSYSDCWLDGEDTP